MSDKIPQLDPDLEVDYSDENMRREKLEYELLELESKSRKMFHREISQRYIVKWVAVVAGVIVIFGMASVLTHLFHNVFLGSFMFVNSAFLVAMIVTPILSITTITVALFFGAFRKFEDKDLEVVGNGIAGAANIVRGG